MGLFECVRFKFFLSLEESLCSWPHSCGLRAFLFCQLVALHWIAISNFSMPVSRAGASGWVVEAKWVFSLYSVLEVN